MVVQEYFSSGMKVLSLAGSQDSSSPSRIKLATDMLRKYAIVDASDRDRECWQSHNLDEIVIR